MEPRKITVAEAKAQLDRGAALLFIDARNAKAWKAADVQLPGAIRVPVDEVEQHLDLIPQGQTLVPYCT